MNKNHAWDNSLFDELKFTKASDSKLKYVRKTELPKIKRRQMIGFTHRKPA